MHCVVRLSFLTLCLSLQSEGAYGEAFAKETFDPVAGTFTGPAVPYSAQATVR